MRALMTVLLVVLGLLFAQPADAQLGIETKRAP
jgi:hypothetical protein